ncbi:hypothetical protein M422DRAFT_268218 [Sphaerobolus stellatus SS14]|uniref:Uncharacterized protein n=1 Tax=Sphaerobolus stellatus (strain SS14) TaxID=990650 RepID=A0A0C9UYM1_SPHS4|nr:hypothetical protein M422DRAFT_268218 [Sphaerobolus stellatus SS14]
MPEHVLSVNKPQPERPPPHPPLQNIPPSPPAAPPSRRQSLFSKHHSQLSQSYQSPANSRHASTLSTAFNISTSNNTSTNTSNLSHSSTHRSSKRSSCPSTSASPPISTSSKKAATNAITPTTPTRINPWPNPHLRLCPPHPDPRHTMSEPDTPKFIRKFLKNTTSLTFVLAQQIPSSHVDLERRLEGDRERE